jgi:MFS transporter, FHS family, glucose/mannose:H+ symporter
MIGALTSFYGPLLPYLETRFGISRTTAGAVLGADFGGSLVGVSWALWGAPRRPLLIALASVAVGTGFVAAASQWWYVLAGVAVAGLGFGILDFSLNRLFIDAFDQGRGAMLNLLNALWGVGAAVGPLLVAVLARRHMSWLFIGTALVAVAVMPLIMRADAPTAPADEPTAPTAPTAAPGVAAAPAGPAVPGASRWRLSQRAWLFVVAYVLYNGVEGGVSGWAPTHLKALGYSGAFADGAVSAFWLCLTASRFLIVPVTLRVNARKIVLGGIAATVLVLMLAFAAPAAPYAYAAAGLTLGPVWPTGLAWLSESDTDAGAVGYLVAASMLGGAVLPYTTGWIIQQAGLRTIPAVVAAFAVGTALALAATSRKPFAGAGLDGAS